MQSTTLPARIRTRRTSFLRDADAALTRIREENRRALEQANRQVRIVDCHCPNIVLFLLNGVGYGDLGVYGQQLIKTPIADILAAQGTQFTQFYAGSPESVASRGTLYSGKLTARGEQAGEDWIAVRERDFTLAESLYQGGYETGLFGVWGAGPVERAGHPNSQGFKCFFGYLDDKSALDLLSADPVAKWRPGSPDRQSGRSEDAVRSRFDCRRCQAVYRRGMQAALLPDRRLSDDDFRERSGGPGLESLRRSGLAHGGQRRARR